MGEDINILAESNIFSFDKEEFKKSIYPRINSDSSNIIFCSLTHITPMYILLFTLKELRRLSQSLNAKVVIVMWDMNTIVHPYFKYLRESKDVFDNVEFLNSKYDELKKIIISCGFLPDEFNLHKSSDVWRKVITYDSENIFQKIYQVFSCLNTNELKNHKCSHIFQDVLDLFMCNNYGKLFPEYSSESINLMYFGFHTEKYLQKI